MADFSDLQAKVGAYFQENKTEIFTQLLLDPSYDTNLELEPNVNDEMVYPRLDVTASARPFNYNYTATDNKDWTASKLKVQYGMIAEQVKSKEYYQNYEKLGVKGNFDPNTIALEQFITDEVIRANQYALRTQTVWKGVHNPSGTGILDVFDGFHKKLVDFVDDEEVVTPLTGVGTPTASNIDDAINEVAAALPLAVRGQKDAQILVSEELFIWYKWKLKALNNGVDIQLLPDGSIQHPDYKNIKVKEEVFLTLDNSKLILGGYKRLFQVGTNMSAINNFTSKTFDRGLYFDLLFTFAMGTNIPWHEYVKINDEL
jgi:hypothetical protein